MEELVKITEIGKDFITVKEADLDQLPYFEHKVHLIRFKFESPTEEKILKVLNHFDNTNRFVVGDNVRLYNGVLKKTSKKYYIQNPVDTPGIISFFRKNNKVLLSTYSLIKEEKEFVLKHALDDVLINLEVIMIERTDYMDNIDKFKNWRGNVVLFDASIHSHYIL
jgi:hypothetical protein